VAVLAVSNPGIVDQVNLLAEASRARGDLVVWVLHADPGTGTVFDPASGHVHLMDGLVPRAGEPVIFKTAHNAFTATNLQQILTSRPGPSTRWPGVSRPSAASRT
jgi:nicotinamidase-related amidase